MKIGILGGSFDPIHQGHLDLSKHVLKELGLQKIILMPTLQTPLKKMTLVSYHDRYQMIKLAIKNYAHFEVSDLEKKLPIPSYTYNTLKKLKQIYPNDQLYWIIGTDQYQQFDKWYKANELLNLAQFVVINRGSKIIEDDCFIFLNNWINPASSTKIRQGEFKYLPKAVRYYIFQKGLYFKDIAQTYCSNKRYAHSVSVANLAVQIASWHKLDQNKTFIAAILHDVCKELDQDKELKIMQDYYPNYLHQARATYHAYTAEHFIKTSLCCSDQEILKAVKHHVLGDCFKPLAKVIYLADKLDPLRGYDTSYELQLIKENLQKGFLYCKKQQKSYLLKKEGIKVD